jgi:hypothetical protein
MKSFLLLVALLGASGQTRAQISRSAARPDSLTASAAPDTLTAIHRLFAAKRKRQGYATGATAVVAIATLITLTNNQPARASGSNDLDALVGAFVTLPLIPAVAIGFGGWGAKYERQVVEQWQQHRLPRQVKRALKANYFQPTKAIP